jgi:phospholipid transport system substrate-binding protein
MTRATKSLPALLAGLWLLLALAPAMADPMPPDELVHRTADEVLAVLRADAGADMKALAELVDTKVVDHFDFDAMTRLAVGKHWRSADDSQRAALVDEFRTLLVRTYSVALQQFVDYHIDYRPLRVEPGAKQAVVQTSVSKDGGGKPIRMDYRMIARDSGWKVYDVLVDGVSLVVNYRSLFGSTVDRSGIDGLIRLLRDKNADGSTG